MMEAKDCGKPATTRVCSLAICVLCVCAFLNFYVACTDARFTGRFLSDMKYPPPPRPTENMGFRFSFASFRSESEETSTPIWGAGLDRRDLAL